MERRTGDDELQLRPALLQSLLGLHCKSGPGARHVPENDLHTRIRSPLRQLLSTELPWSGPPCLFASFLRRITLSVPTALPLNFHPAAIRASANVTPFGAVSVPA